MLNHIFSMHAYWHQWLDLAQAKHNQDSDTVQTADSVMTVSCDLKARVPIVHYELGFSVKDVCKILGIHKSLVYKTVQYYSIFGIFFNLYAQSQSCQLGFDTGTGRPTVPPKWVRLSFLTNRAIPRTRCSKN